MIFQGKKLVILFNMNFKHSLEVRDTAVCPVCLIVKFCVDIWLQEHTHMYTAMIWKNYSTLLSGMGTLRAAVTAKK